MSSAGNERWHRIDELLDAALDLPATERDEFLERACANDEALRLEVVSLLEASERSNGFLDRSVIRLLPHTIEASDAQSVIPARVGRYRIVRQLGRGGMGTVFLAERDDGAFHQQVALKLVRGGVHGVHADERLVRRFHEERQILASLEHPGVARLVDGGIVAGLPWFAMEYVEGKPIDRYCDERRAGIEERLRLFCDVCEAVQYAHERSVVHRDVKPSNIMVTAAGEAKLLDFGIAKVVAATSEVSDTGARPTGLTRTGERLLTPEYASPEQVRGQPVTPSSDVYSLGVLLYVLLTGRLPFQSATRTLHDLERAILEEDAARPSDVVTLTLDGPEIAAPAGDVSAARQTTPRELQRRLRGDLDAIVLHAMRKDPQQRYASAAALAADVRQHLDGRPVQARGAVPAYRLGRFVRRHRVSVGALGAGIVVGALLLPPFLRGDDEGRDRSTPGAEPSFGALQPASVLAIGRIADHRSGSRTLLDPLTDLLVTNLGRTPGVRVVSVERMHQMLRRNDDASAAAGADLVAAARRAGATEIIDGAVYNTSDGGLRVDLRRVDLASGTVIAVQSASGADLFTLADEATRGLAGQFGVAPPPGSVSDVTTRSLAAFGHYAQGLREYYRGDRGAAARLFAAALAQDSTFAMAAYYHALAPGLSQGETRRRLERALALADRASDRERLIVRAAAARAARSRSLRAIAETLSSRYPAGVEGPFYLGTALAMEGDELGSLAQFRRVVEIDTIGMHVGFVECAACLAYVELVAAYLHADSFPAAVRMGAEGRRRHPDDPNVWLASARSLIYVRRYDEARQHFDSAAARMPSADYLPLEHALVWLYAERYDSADALLRPQLQSASVENRNRARWLLTLSLRAQGRLREALAVARATRAVSVATDGAGPAGSVTPNAMIEAQLLAEQGKPIAAAALFDSIARWRSPREDHASYVQNRAWALAHRASALAAAGDTGQLEAIASEVERLGAGSAFRRNQLLHRYVRGLLFAARRDDAAAESALRQAYYNPALGDSRINVALAELLRRGARPREAVTVLQAALRGSIESSGSYVGRTELHERLATAWEAAGGRDSAVVHWGQVSRNWARADAELRPRRAAAGSRLAALASR